MSFVEHSHQISNDTDDVDIEEEIVDEVKRNQFSSVGQIPANVRVPKSTAQRVLKRHLYYPFHVQRVQFCRRVLIRRRRDEVSRILRTDECHF